MGSRARRRAREARQAHQKRDHDELIAVWTTFICVMCQMYENGEISLEVVESVREHLREEGINLEITITDKCQQLIRS